MPRSTTPSKQSKITTMPIRVPQHRNLPALVPEKPSFLQTMKEGLALGVGSSLGHRIVNSFMGPPTIKVETNTEYETCMKEYNDTALCKEHSKLGKN
jgi:hypothetical protein